MKFGLSESDYSYLYAQLIEPLQALGAEVFIFGSRADGKYKKFSDIDLLYTDPRGLIKSAQINELKAKMEASAFPYKIDLVKDTELASSYRQNVDRQKQKL